MCNRIDIDPEHSRAIVQEIGERLRALLKEEPELPGGLGTQIDRLHELEEPLPSTVSSIHSHWRLVGLPFPLLDCDRHTGAEYIAPASGLAQVV